MIACYARVSTSDQKLPRQVRSVLPYVEDKFGTDIGQDITEVGDYVSDENTSDDPISLAGGDVMLFYDRLTGTNTDRKGYHDLMDAVDSGDVDAVVSDAVSRVSRSLRDLDRTAERVVEQNNAELHLIKEGFQLIPGKEDPFQRAMFRLLGVFAELEAELAQLRAREGLQTRIEADENYRHGRAPLGFVKSDGEIRPGPDYDLTVSTLRDVAEGYLSKRKAAKRLDTSRRTINRSLNDRSELYGL
ncbi:recombinase family protein [Natronosalvus amylolyticus]|uniref:recombinase family protein n=1 Tax=Natronosalvus amylolyticus TaxID=2961994 RepID=UPI0020C9E3DE|nr:recombinase family protein [Natronosalvus amylolyticus]